MKEVLSEDNQSPSEGENKIPDYVAFSEAFRRDEDSPELLEILHTLIENGSFSAVLRYSQALLAEIGVVEVEGLDHTDPAVALALAEAINLAAKTIDYRFYEIKPALVVSAWKMGARFGYNNNDNTYSLFDPSVGTASFHDPNGDIRYIIEKLLVEEEPEWPHDWSGIPRQNLAFDILNSLNKMDDLIAELIRSTTPEPLQGEGIDFHSRRKDTLLEKYGKNSVQVKLRDFVLISEDEQVRTLLNGLKKDVTTQKEIIE